MENTRESLTGEKLLKAAINQILSHPETWDQGAWHSGCGTKHCLAGWCQILSGKPASDGSARADAKEALGITEHEAQFLFRSTCTLPEMHRFAAHWNAVDRDGYDRAGYDRDGKKLQPFDL